MPRQQRRDSSRGQSQLPNRRPAPDLLWSIVNPSGNDVDVEIQNPIDEIVVRGVPPFTCTETAELPTAVVQAGNVLTLTFTTPPPSDFHLSLPPLNSAVRAANGSFLAGGEQHFVPAAVPDPLTIAVVSANGNVATLAEYIDKGANVTRTLPAPTFAGEVWLFFADPQTGTTCNVNDPSPAFLMNVGRGQIKTATWNGTTWTPALIDTISVPPNALDSSGAGGPIVASQTTIPANNTPTYSLPIAGYTGETWNVGCNAAALTTCQVNDNGGTGVQFITFGQLWSFAWNGASWSVQQLI